MRSRLQLLVRVVATLVIIVGLTALSPTAAEANMTCSGGSLMCSGHGFCNDEYAEAYCQGLGGADCHMNGWECVVWPWNGCGYGEDRPQYFCYGT